MNSIKKLNWRFATKEYDKDKKLTKDQLFLIKESFRLSPSSFGVQPWKFIHVADSEIRSQLREFAWNQPQITDASELFVLCVPTEFTQKNIDKLIERTAKIRNQSVEDLKSYNDMIGSSLLNRTPAELESWMTHQLYIALGVSMTVASENDIDTTPMEGFDSSKFDEILKLKEMNLKSKVLLTFGFRSENDKYSQAPKVRYDDEEVFVEI